MPKYDIVKVKIVIIILSIIMTKQIMGKKTTNAVNDIVKLVVNTCKQIKRGITIILF